MKNNYQNRRRGENQVFNPGKLLQIEINPGACQKLNRIPN